MRVRTSICIISLFFFFSTYCSHCSAASFFILLYLRDFVPYLNIYLYIPFIGWHSICPRCICGLCEVSSEVWLHPDFFLIQHISQGIGSLIFHSLNPLNYLAHVGMFLSVLFDLKYIHHSLTQTYLYFFFPPQDSRLHKLKLLLFSVIPLLLTSYSKIFSCFSNILLWNVTYISVYKTYWQSSGHATP